VEISYRDRSATLTQFSICKILFLENLFIKNYIEISQNDFLKSAPNHPHFFDQIAPCTHKASAGELWQILENIFHKFI
jgi:hypothetical protein